MSTKINNLLKALPPGGVATQTWLKTQSVDARLADKYVRSGWLTRVGRGAYARADQTVDWPAGLHALQQDGRLVYPGGATVLELRGYTHYVPAGSPRPLILFGPPQSKLPSWFQQGDWSRDVHYMTPRLFRMDDQPKDVVTIEGMPLELPPLERAALEVMWQVPKRLAFEEARQLVESLTVLRPDVVQYYLEVCRSVKSKRLLLYCAKQLELPWYRKISVNAVDLGSGPRTIHAGGQLDKTYNLVVHDPETY